MPAPTNPKKKDLMPSTPLRSKLRGIGHALTPIVQVGKEGTTAGVIKQVTQALFDHELVKVKIGSECPETRFEVAEKLAAEPGINVVQILGRVVLLYKRHPHKPRYEGARAEGGEADDRKTAPKRKRKASPKGRRKPSSV